jgi:hypothetical protein
MSPATAQVTAAQQIPLAAVGLANQYIDRWLADTEQSGVACRVNGRAPEIREGVLRQVECVLRQADPVLANRRWLCGTLRAWATLRVLFPRGAETSVFGVSGELDRHFKLVIEREYAHVLAGVRSIDRARDILLGDAQCLELQVEIGDALRNLLADRGEAKSDWLPEFRALSLAMAEYLHRHALGLGQLITDSAVMSYTGQLARIQRECRAPDQRRQAAVSGA